MTQNTAAAVDPMQGGQNNYYQISDDDLDDCDDLNDDCLLEEASSGQENFTPSGRGPYERAWTTDATRALIHIRGPMEGMFTAGRQKRTALWLHCTRQMQKLGFRYSAAKVQKKWHNILITYNKNLAKKYQIGYVHWEFFEEMFKYLQGKKADCDMFPLQSSTHQQQQSHHPPQQNSQQSHTIEPSPAAFKRKQEMERFRGSPNTNEMSHPYGSNSNQLSLLAATAENTAKSNDDFDEDSTIMSELKQPKLEYISSDLPLEITHDNGFDEQIAHKLDHPDYTHIVNGAQEDNVWWKDYFERKLEIEREKIQCQKDMQREQMQFNKKSLVQQENMERLKIDAINNLTATLQKLVEAKNRSSKPN